MRNATHTHSHARIEQTSFLRRSVASVTVSVRSAKATVYVLTKEFAMKRFMLDPGLGARFYEFVGAVLLERVLLAQEQMMSLLISPESS